VSKVQEENKALVRRFVQAQADGDLDAAKEMMAPNFVARSLLPGQEPDRNGYLRATAEYHAAFSGIRYIIERQLAEGDEVVTSFSARLTHDREYEGFAPTGREHVLTGIFIHRIAGGRIVEESAEGTGLLELVEQRLEQEERERERIEQELRVARSIQQASLPKEVPTLEGWHISPYYRPAKEVGGDFYDFHLLSEGKLGLVVGDASGKGVPAALVMSTTCGMLRAVSRALDSPSPGEMLERINEALFPYIPPNTFVTCFYAILDPERGSLSYANAGHDLPYLWRGNDAEELRARGMPLGLMPDTRYEEKEIELDAAEGVLFYSDGLVDAHDTKGEMFSFPRLRELVAEHGQGEEGRALRDVLMEELYSFTGEEWEQEDDITLATLQRSTQ
jgi:serine phosphatase RsbU (regulator of sigma subunit)/predicted ester cyclase